MPRQFEVPLVTRRSVHDDHVEALTGDRFGEVECEEIRLLEQRLPLV